MRVKELLVASTLVFLAACGGGQKPADETQGGLRFDPSKSDPKAVKIADQVMIALGGRTNWEQVRYLSFRFIVERGGEAVVSRRHYWDRQTGRYRYEDSDEAGRQILVLFNLNTKEGTAYVGDTSLDGDTLRAMIEKAYARHINDTYWLLMPYKMKDPGVILKYVGTEDLGGFLHDVVQLSFENVGLTPNDRYWAYIDQASRLMSKWEYILKGGPGPRTVVWWKDWKPYWKIKLAETREFEKGDRRILFRDIVVSPTVDESVFESPLTAK
jgi:hypothetical protein